MISYSLNYTLKLPAISKIEGSPFPKRALIIAACSAL
jgi:hypothetical protein